MTPAALLPLLLRHWRTLAAVAALAAAALFIRGRILDYGDARAQAGADAVRVLWEADTAARDAAAAAQRAENQAREERWRVESARIAHEYQKQVDAAVARGSQYERLLREARDQVHPGGGAADAGAGGAAGPAASAGTGELDALLAAVLVEREANDAQLAALIEVVRQHQ
jgi:hypothetical protein